MAAGAGDIASLGLAIDPTPIKTASAALREFSGEASQAQGKVQGVASATDSLIAALSRNTAAQNSQSTSLAAVTSALNQTISALSGLVERQRQVQAAEAATSAALDRTASSHKNLAAATSASDAAANSHVAAARQSAAADAESARQVESLTDKLRQLSAARAQVIVTAAQGGYGAAPWTAQAQGGSGGPTVAPPNHVAAPAPVTGPANSNAPLPTPMPPANTNGWSAMRAEIDPVWASQERLNTVIAEGTKLLASGTITQDVYNRAVSTATQRHQDLTDKIAAQTRGVGLARHEWQNLAYQLNDVSTMALMGASPYQIATSQGGQILQTMAGSAGGITGSLKSMGESLVSAVARIGLLGGAAGAAATAVGLLAYATISYRSDSDMLKRTRFGLGEASGATVADMQRSATEASAGGKISPSQARDVIGQLNAMGTVDPKVYASAADSAGRLARALNTDMADATSQVVGGLTNGIRGFDTLNEKLLLVDGNTRQHIEDLYKAGDAYKAQGIIVDALAKKLKDASDERGMLSRGWDAFKSFATRNADAAGGSLSSGYNDPEVQLAAARKRVEDLTRMGSAMGTGGGNVAGSFADRIAGSQNRALADAQAEVAKIEAGMSKSAESAKAAGSTLKSLTVAPLVESLNPAQKRIDDITAQANMIQKYLDSGGDKLDKDGQARRTMDGLKAQAEQLTAELAKGGTSLANGLQAAQFNLSQVGFSDYARQRNQLEENAKLERQAATDANQEPGKRAEILKGIDEKLAVAIKALDQQTILAGQSAAATGGRFSRTVADAPENMRQLILNSSKASGIDPDMISSALYQESRYKNGLTSPAGARGVAQFMPKTADEMGVDVTSIESSIMGMGAYMRKLSKVIGSNDPNDILMAYNWGPGNFNNWAKNGRNPNSVPQETRDYVRNIAGGRVGSSEQVKDLEDRTRALKTQAEAERMTAEANGRDTESLQTRIEVMQRVSDAQARNIPVTEALIQQYQREASERAKLATQARQTQYNIQTGWDRDQIGYDRQNQTARSLARSVTGSTDMTTPQAQKIIGESLNNQSWLDAKNQTVDGLTTLAQQLRQGATFAQAFNSALDRTVDKLLSNALDTAVSSLFKGLQGSIGTGGGFDIAKLWPFANGGIMTASGAMQLRTYARGGVADSPQLAMYAEAGPEAYVPLPDGRRIPVALQGGGSGPASGGGGNPVAVINMTGQPTETRTVQGPRGARTEVLIGKGVMGAVASGELDGVLRERFGVRPVGR